MVVSGQWRSREQDGGAQTAARKLEDRLVPVKIKIKMGGGGGSVLITFLSQKQFCDQNCFSKR